MAPHFLDNPIWRALTDTHAQFSKRNASAARYLPNISPLAGLASADSANVENLVELLAPNDTVAVLNMLIEHAALEPVAELELAQWTCDRLIAPTPIEQPLELGAADAADMYALAKATDPGPFEIDTYQLGDYIGVRKAGELVAMCGERIALPGFCEVSGVCTAPAFNGRGYARGLVGEIVSRQLARGVTPFLHVRRGSPSEVAASKVYAALGFSQRSTLTMRVFRRRA